MIRKLRMGRQFRKAKFETETVDVAMTHTFSLLRIKPVKNLRTTSWTTGSLESVRGSTRLIIYMRDNAWKVFVVATMMIIYGKVLKCQH